MALLDEIGARLAAQAVAGTSAPGGWELTKSLLPDTTAIGNTVVALTETPGLPSSPRPTFEQPTFQVQVRGTVWTSSSAYPDARDKAADVVDALHGFAGSLSGVHYPGIWAQQAPFLLEWDANQRPVLAVNFRAIRSGTT